MRLYITDAGAHLNRGQLEQAKKLGFDGLICSDIFKGEQSHELAANCAELGLPITVLCPQWPLLGDLYKMHPEWAFRDHEGNSSFGTNKNLLPLHPWPSFWCPDPAILGAAYGQMKEAAKLVGDNLAGMIITPSALEAKMPSTYWDAEGRIELMDRYWCWDKWAKKEWEEDTLRLVELARNPEEDTDRLTMLFCQRAMIHRIDELCELALDFTNNLWVFSTADFQRSRPRNMAAGYTRFDKPLTHWRNEFGTEHGVEVGLFVPVIYVGPKTKALFIHRLAGASGGEWRIMTGAQADQPTWRDNVIANPLAAKDAGINDIIFDYDMVLRPGNEEHMTDALTHLRRQE